MGRLASLINGELYGYQKDSVRFVLNHNYVILNLEQGTGKTLIAIANIALAGGKSVVVCPSFLKENWLNEFRKFAPQIKVKICDTK